MARDYTLKIASPAEAFTGGIQLGQQARQNQLLEQQRRAALEKQKRQIEAFGRLGPQSTYQDYADALQEFPDQIEGLTGFYKSLTEAKRNALFGAGQNAWMRLRPGADGNIDPTQAVAELEAAAKAFENSRDPESARQLRDVAAYVKADPANGAKTIGMVLTANDPERAKAMMGSAENTALQKDEAFIREKFGDAAADQFVQNRYDPIVSIPLPGGRVYFGPRSGMGAIGGGGIGGGAKPSPQPGDVQEGYRFKGGDPSVASNWEKVR